MFTYESRWGVDLLHAGAGLAIDHCGVVHRSSRVQTVSSAADNFCAGIW